MSRKDLATAHSGRIVNQSTHTGASHPRRTPMKTIARSCLVGLALLLFASLPLAAQVGCPSTRSQARERALRPSPWRSTTPVRRQGGRSPWAPS